MSADPFLVRETQEGGTSLRMCEAKFVPIQGLMMAWPADPHSSENTKLLTTASAKDEFQAELTSRHDVWISVPRTLSLSSNAAGTVQTRSNLILSIGVPFCPYSCVPTSESPALRAGPSR